MHAYCAVRLSGVVQSSSAFIVTTDRCPAHALLYAVQFASNFGRRQCCTSACCWSPPLYHPRIQQHTSHARRSVTVVSAIILSVALLTVPLRCRSVALSLPRTDTKNSRDHSPLCRTADGAIALPFRRSLVATHRHEEFTRKESHHQVPDHQGLSTWCPSQVRVRDSPPPLSCRWPAAMGISLTSHIYPQLCVHCYKVTSAACAHH
jgi:hypothetical protein